ncbi:hypothetical protein NL676_039233 [Syzygium grande]|nr:hypothetical protein NL676_039233 [Syzygium grande]
MEQNTTGLDRMSTLLDDLQVNPVPHDWASIGKPPRRASSDVRLPQCMRTSPEDFADDGARQRWKYPAMRWNRSTEISRRDAERIEVATAGLEARCRELRHGRHPEITVPKVGRREEAGRRSSPPANLRSEKMGY